MRSVNCSFTFLKVTMVLGGVNRINDALNSKHDVIK